MKELQPIKLNIAGINHNHAKRNLGNASYKKLKELVPCEGIQSTKTEKWVVLPDGQEWHKDYLIIS